MTTAIVTWTRRLILALMLPLVCLAGNVAPYILAVTCIGLFVLLLVRRELVGSYREPLAALFLLVFVVLGICFSITAEEPRDALSAFNFIMLLLAGPLAYVLAKGAGEANAPRVASLALAGAAIALAIVLVQIAGGAGRGKWVTLGPIRMANTAVVLGFIALIGWFAVAGAKRWLYALGPVIGVAVTFLTQSRGPLLAIAFAVPVAFAFFVRSLPRRFVPFAVAGALLVIVAGVVALAMQPRVAALPEVIRGVLAGEEVADFSTRMRLLLYGAAIEAFRHAPIVGYGWHDLMEAVIPYLDASAPGYARRLPQLHNDVFDFAVAAGVVGIAMYLMILAAPIVAAIRSPRDSQRTVRLYGATVLVAAYAGAGLTDLMFGFEFHTALYVAMAAIVVGYCRDTPPAGARGATSSGAR